MAETGIDFGQSSTPKYSLRGFLNKQETAMPIAQDMAQAMVVASNAVKTYSAVEDEAQQHKYFNATIEFNNLKAQQQEALGSVGNDLTKQREVLDAYKGTFSSLSDKYELSDKYKASLGGAVESHNSGWEEKYRSVYNARQESIALDNISQVSANLVGVPKEDAATTLQALKEYYKTMTGGDDRTAGINVFNSYFNSKVTSLEAQDMNFEQAKQFRKDIVETAKLADPKIISTDAYEKAKNTADTLVSTYRAKAEDDIKALVSTSSVPDKLLKETLDRAISDGILTREKANGYADIYVSRNRKDRRDLIQTSLRDMDISEEEASKLVSDPKASFSSDEKDMLLKGFEISKKRYNLDIAVKSIVNIASDPTTSVEDRLNIVNKASELTTNPIEKLAFQTQLNKLQKEKEVKDKQDASNIIMTKGLDFGTKVASVFEIYPEDSPNRAKLIGRAIAEENKRLAGKTPESKIEQKDFNAYINNPEKTLEDKWIATDNASHLTGTEKDSIKAQLAFKASTQAKREAKATNTETREVYKNIYNEIKAQAADGIYDRSPTEVLNAAAGSYAGKATPVSVKAFIDKYADEYDMYQDFKAGKDNTTNPKYLNNSLSLRPDLKQNIEATFNSASDSNTLMSAVNTVKSLERGKYLIPKDISEKARVASIFLQYSPENAGERFQKYLREPVQVANITKQVEKIRNDISSSQGMLGGWGAFDLPEEHPFLKNIDSIAEASLKAGMSKDEIKTMLHKGAEENFVDVASTFKARSYIPKTSFILSKQDYTNMLDMVSVKTSVDASFAYPSDFTDPENSSWSFRIKKPNGTIETVSYSASDIKTLLNIKKVK